MLGHSIKFPSCILKTDFDWKTQCARALDRISVMYWKPILTEKRSVLGHSIEFPSCILKTDFDWKMQCARALDRISVMYTSAESFLALFSSFSTLAISFRILDPTMHADGSHYVWFLIRSKVTDKTQWEHAVLEFTVISEMMPRRRAAFSRGICHVTNKQRLIQWRCIFKTRYRKSLSRNDMRQERSVLLESRV